MPKIDIDNYIEQSGMRKARFGGYEPEDVHQAMEDLCADYEQHLTAMTSELRTLRQENDALRRRLERQNERYDQLLASFRQLIRINSEFLSLNSVVKVSNLTSYIHDLESNVRTCERAMTEQAT